jgi:hypothetical protein
VTGSFPIHKDFKRNLFWRRKFLKDACFVPGVKKALLDECAANPLFYINYFGCTHDPRLKFPVQPFIAYEFQDEAIMDIITAIRKGYDVGIVKSRDMGASWVNLFAVDWMFRFNPHSSYLLVSRNEDYVDKPGDPKSLFWRLDFIRKYQPKWLQPNVKRTSLHMENLDNGAVIDGESTTGEVGRGDRRTAILMDEYAAFEVKAAEAAHASTSQTTNCRIFNSTPRGQGNPFYTVIHGNGRDGGGKAEKIVRMHWSKHPRKNRGLYTSERDEKGYWKLKLLDDWEGNVQVGDKEVAFPDKYDFILDGKLRSPWYDKECKRATGPAQIAQELDMDFAGSDYLFFDAAFIENYRRKWCREPDAIGELEYSLSDYSPSRFADNPKGRLRLWSALAKGGKPEIGRRFVMGVDISAGTGASNSAASIYDLKTREKVGEYVTPNQLPVDFAGACVAIARFFNNAYIAFDRSGPTGEVFAKKLRDIGYGNLVFQKKRGDDITPEQKPGVFLNPSVRTALLHDYRAAIGEERLINRSDESMAETNCFICKMDGSIEHSSSANATDPSGARANHGDRVIADALGWYAIDQQGVADDEPKDAPIPPNSIAGRMKAWRASHQEQEEEYLSEGWDV